MKNSVLVFPLVVILGLISSSAFGQKAAFTDSLSPNTGCAPVTVNFIDQSTGATSWFWNFGDSNSSGNQNPNHTYGTPGTYTVTLTINGGTDSVSHQIVVHAIPSASFVISNTNICVGTNVNFTSTSTAGSGIISQIIWDFGDGHVDSTTTSTNIHSYSAPGTYSVNILAFNNFGCYNASNSQLIFVTGPAASFTASPPAACQQNTNITFTNTTTGSTTGTTYLWNFGDPSSGANDTSTQASPTHTFSSYNSYTVTLTATTGVCSTTYTYIFVQQQLNISITSPDTVCFGSAVSFSDTSSSPKPTFQLWYFDDPLSGPNDTSSLANPIHIFSSAGPLTISVTAGISSTCSTTVTKNIYVRSLPDVSFTASDTSFCKSSTVNFSGFSLSQIVSWVWNFGDPSSGYLNKDSVQNPSHFYNQSGNYSVTLIVTDSFGCVDSLTKVNYIQINPPLINITTPPDSGCAPKDFSFLSSVTTASGDSVIQYSWNFGDPLSGVNDTSSLISPSHTYSLCGIYDVSLSIMTLKGCADSISKTGIARVGNKPTAKFSPDSATACFGAAVQFHDSSISNGCPITAWNWNFGAFTQNPLYLFSDTGIYDVRLIVYSNGCSDTLQKNKMITVYPPVPDFSAAFRCDSPFVVTFTDLSRGADSLLWNFGDPLSGTSDTSSRANPVHIFSSTGTYTVDLHASNNTYSCSYDTTKTIRITQPIARFSASDTVKCHPAAITFRDSSQDASSYSWNFGDPASGPNNTSTLPGPNHTFKDTGFYTVQLIIKDIHNCTDTVTGQIRVIGPTAGFTANATTGCAPFKVLFTDTSDTSGSPISSYHWTFNYGKTPLDTGSTTNPVDSFTFLTGNYNIQLIVMDGNGCRDTTLKNNFITATFPNPSLAVDTFVCPNTSNSYLVHPGVQTSTYSVTWDFGDGTLPVTIPNDSTTTHTYTADNIYPLTVIVTDANGCSDTVRRNIYVLTPVASFTVSNPSSSCGYTQVTLIGNNSNYIYKWNYTVTGPYNIIKHNTDSTDSVYNVSFNYPGKWTITLIVTNPGCTDDTISVPYVVPGSAGYFTFKPDHGCSPLTVTFYVDSIDSATFIEYDFGDGSPIPQHPITDTIVSHTYYPKNGYSFVPQVYLGYLQSNGNTCPVSLFNRNNSLLGLNDTVTINSPDTVNITQTTILLFDGQKDTLTATPYNATWTYTWKAIPSGTILPTLVPPTSAIYTGANGDTGVVLTVKDPNGCEAYDTVEVIIKPCEDSLKIPNVFTPNGDAKNDTYYIENLCPLQDFKITVYNRWGNIVYQSNDYRFRWDGKDDNGKECSVGTYYYIIHARRGNLHGYIHLIRN